MTDFFQDIRYAFRILLKRPAFTAVALIALALGIGANSAIFSVVYNVLLRPLPYSEPDRLAMVWGKFDKEGIPRNWISEPELFDLKEQNQSFEDLAAYSTTGVNLTGNGNPEWVPTAVVSASLFDILRVNAERGRTFAAQEDEAGKNRVVLLSQALWKRRFGADPNVVGSTVSLDGESLTVIGVMPPGFSFPDEVAMWLPLGLDRARLNSRGSHYLQMIGRLKQGVSFDQARDDLARIAGNLSQQFPDNYREASGWGLYAVPLHEQTVGSVRPALLVLLGAVRFVLLIACANVANLLLARASAREKEIAIRAALGARRARIVRQLMTESIVLALVGGIMGIALAFLSLKAFTASGPRNIPRLADIQLNGIVLAFSFLVSIITGIVFGLAPAIHVSRPNLQGSLKDGGRTSGSGSGRLRSVLVVSEVALALVLLVGAGLMMRSFSRLTEVKLGHHTDNVLTAGLSLPQARYRENALVATYYKRLLESLRDAPGVESAGIVSQLPLSGSGSSGTTMVEDTSVDEGQLRRNGYAYIEADRRSVSPGYFAAMGIPLLNGRLLSESDNETAPAVVVVDTGFAKRFWPNSDAVGKRISVGGGPQGINWGTIVGVVEHVKHYDPSKEGREQVYFSYLQRPLRTMYVAIHAAGSAPLMLAGPLTEKVRGLDGDQPVYEISTMDRLLSASVAQPRLNLMLLGFFAALALLLASVGIYGVMAYSVSQRTHEIGIRMALGAESKHVIKLIVGQGFALVIAGVVIGLAGSFLLARLLSSFSGLLYGVTATDSRTFAAVSILIIGVSIFASYIPARKATRVDPIIALRYE